LVLSLRPAAAEEIGQASVLQARLDGAESLVLGGRNLPLEELQALYSARNYRPLWVDKDGLTPRGRVARRTLVDAFDEGLNPAHYFVTDIEARNAPRRPSAIVELDLLLSAGLITYLGDLTEGRLAPHEHDPLLFAKPQAPDRLHLLDGLAESPDLAAALAALAPPHAQYRALKTGLARYRELASSSAPRARACWPCVIAWR
jgi:murein L,D-transpeptidase YcbB/YkuD